ncbi:MAG: glycosyltransferase, partial [Gemmatimonadales bacterium]
MTERPRPAVSVVIPTHNRRDLLSRVLDALAPQLDAEVEVVVVADGCSDGTVEMLKARTDFAPRLVERPGLGPSVARNAGAAAAQGALLVFIDDDVIPGKGWLAAHRAAAAANPGSVVLGPYPPARVASRDLFRLDMRAWWDTHFARLAEPGHRITYTDVLTGNLSLPSDLWRRLGGLDERIWHPEDYELGLRLIGAGHPVVIAPDAEAVHHEHETMTLAGSFRRCRHEARGDVIIAEKHPEIARRLKPVKWRRWGSRLAGIRDRVIFACGAGLDGAARWVERRLPWIGRHGLRKTHETVKRYLQSYWYVRGLRDHFSRFADWQAFALQPWPEPEGPATTIDLADGLKAAEARLDALRPAAVDLFLGERYVGHLPRQAGAEPWAGRHLRGEIYRHHGPAYLRAIAGARADPTPTADPGRLDEALARMSGWFGTSDPPWVFYEQSAQWGRGPAAERDSTPPAGPALSFIVPAWNAAATVDETLASLQAQTRTDWEAIVVDDGSTDDTLARLRAAAARDWRIRVLPIARSGAGAARNAGLARARADWIAFLDADDWLDPTFAEKMLLLAQSAGTEAVYCGFRKVTSDGAFQLDFFDADFETDVFGTLASRCAITIHSVVVRRQAVLEAGAFLPPNLPCEDWDLWLRLARRGAKFKGLAETLAFYRLGQASVTTDYRHLANGGFRVLELAHGPDARVADPAPGCAEGAPPENLPWLKMFYALWCAGADIGAGGTGDGFLDALPRPLPVFGHEQALARSFAEALVTGARLPPAQRVGRLASWDAAIGRRLDELAEGQPRDG